MKKRLRREDITLVNIRKEIKGIERKIITRIL